MDNNSGSSLRIVLLFISTVFLGGGLTFVYTIFMGPMPRSAPVSLEDRIVKLTNALNGASKAISDIEAEIVARQALVERLREDAELAEKIATLNREQSDAVAQALKVQLDRQDRRAFWLSVLTNIFFTCLGVLLSEIVHRWRWSRRTYAYYPSPYSHQPPPRWPPS